jgi:hypothetical protein
MTANKYIFTHPLMTSLCYPLIVFVIGGIIYFDWQSNKEKKINTENTQNSKVESLERSRIVDSMEHSEFKERLKKLEFKTRKL